MNAIGTVWEDREIEVIVADYFHRLQLEPGGGKFNKAEHSRALQNRLGRTRGSIEYRHPNTSAVLEMPGTPFTGGCMPAANYQARLFETVEEQLVGDRLLMRLSDQPDDADVPPAGIEFHDPPQRCETPKEAGPEIRRILDRLDPASRDARARKPGEAGERCLFQSEQNGLSPIGRDDLAGMVRWVSKEDGDGIGYDIPSFSDRGDPGWLEVRTTNGPATTPFRTARNELRVSKENPAHFRPVRLYDLSRTPAAFQLKPPLLGHVCLGTAQYTVRS